MAIGNLLAVSGHLLIVLWALGWSPSFPPKARADSEVLLLLDDGSNATRELVFDLRDSVLSAVGEPGEGAEAAPRAVSPAARARSVAAGAEAQTPPAGPDQDPSPTAGAEANVLDDPFTDWFLNRSGGFRSRGPPAQGTGPQGSDESATAGGRGGDGGSRDRPGKGPVLPSRARPATLLPDWDCHYPGEMDDTGFVSMTATVKPDGMAESVEILSDPGHGFAQVALGCAMRQPFLPALDERGVPVRGKTRPFIVRFIH